MAEEKQVPQGFIAFASGNPALAETLESAAEAIRAAGVADLITWQRMQIGGRMLLPDICEAITGRDLFIAEVSILNPNVLFELGFALALRKRIWLLLDSSLASARSGFDRFQLLTTVGFREFTNSQDVIRRFYEDQPYLTRERTVYRDIFDSPVRSPQSRLLYLKSLIETDACIKMSRRVARARFSVTVDDPKEMRLQPLSWYARNAHTSLGVVAHFLSENHSDALMHNAKLALISGMALGFGKPLLMLAHEPYTSPLDYRDLLKTHSTASQCETLTGDWIAQLEQTVSANSTTIGAYQEHLKAQTQLQQVSLGDPIAEHEIEELPEYFVMTAAYNEALRAKHSIVVGRKGTGKTATLYQLAHEIGNDRRNHVCVVKPVAYELEGILRILSLTIPKSEQGYLIESLWKFVLYSELAKSVYEDIRGRPSYVQPDQQELDLLQFMDMNASVLLTDFSIRLESAVARLESVDKAASTEAQRLRISELLHGDLLPKLRLLLGAVLNRKQKVAILVDNLDKAWDQRSDLGMLSQLLFGLLAVSGRIAQEFDKSGLWRTPANVCLVLFLRSDIYAKVVTFAKERDKLPVRFIYWDDSRLLLRVVEERFARTSALAIGRPDEVWAHFFCAKVVGMQVQDFIGNAILPRPRDLIYFVRGALDHAVNSGHIRIEEEDLLAAEKQYSRYALDSLVVEGATELTMLEELLYEFAGLPEVIDLDAVRKALDAIGSSDDPATVADKLADLTFLGLEVQTNRFEFLFNDNERPKFRSMARRILEDSPDSPQRFRIARPFQAYLEISRTLPLFSPSPSA
jgi:hypothetical protein